MFVSKILTIPLLALCPIWLAHASTGTFNETIRNRCEVFRSSRDPRWFNLETAVALLDFSKRPSRSTKDHFANLESRSLNIAVQARLKALKSLFDNADEFQSAQALLAHFDQLKSLPERITEAETLDGTELMAYLGTAKGNIRSLYREAFALTVLALANRQPFLVLSDTRTIPILAEAIFTEDFAHGEFLSPAIPTPARFLEYRIGIDRKIKEERAQLLEGTKLRLSTGSEAAIQIWRDELSLICDWDGISLRNVTKFALRLGISFTYRPSEQSGFDAK